MQEDDKRTTETPPPSKARINITSDHIYSQASYENRHYNTNVAGIGPKQFYSIDGEVGVSEGVGVPVGADPRDGGERATADPDDACGEERAPSLDDNADIGVDERAYVLKRESALIAIILLII